MMERMGGLLYHYFGTGDQFESYYQNNENDQPKKILSSADYQDIKSENDLRLLISEVNEYNKEIMRKELKNDSKSNLDISKGVIHKIGQYSILETYLRNGTIFNRLYK